MDKIDITSTSREHAVVSDIVLRDGPKVQLIFKPELVKSDNYRDGTVRGTLVYRRKGKENEVSSKLRLNQLKAGDEIAIELHAAEVYNLRKSLYELAGAVRNEGIPLGKRTLLRSSRNLIALLQEFDQFLKSSNDASDVLTRLLRLFSRDKKVMSLLIASPEAVLLNSLLALTALRELQLVWNNMRDNPREEDWQNVFTKFNFVLSQLFDRPVTMVKDKAYVGGKGLDNRSGLLVDYILKTAATGGAILIEIKAPVTQLLGSEYRQTYPLSHELSGAIAQVLQYRDSLMSDWHSITRNNADLSHCQPYCLVIAGDSAQLDSPEKRAAFERFRQQLSGVSVVTFDEVFGKVDRLVSLLEQGK